jgi:hypothetical protein
MQNRYYVASQEGFIKMFNSIRSFKCFEGVKNKPLRGLSQSGLITIFFKAIMPRKYVQYFNQPCKRWIFLEGFLRYYPVKKHKGKGTKSILLALSSRRRTCSPFHTTNIKLITLMA